MVEPETGGHGGEMQRHQKIHGFPGALIQALGVLQVPPFKDGERQTGPCHHRRDQSGRGGHGGIFSLEMARR